MCQGALVGDMNGTRKGKSCCISFIVTDVTRRDCRLATMISQNTLSNGRIGMEFNMLYSSRVQIRFRT
jgi:hypothetical protein